MEEVAAAAGVAVSSVSRVLSDDPRVSPAMRARVMREVERLGYERNGVAQSLRRGATMLVGFVATDLVNPAILAVIRGAETTLREAGYSVLLSDSENDPARDAEAISVLNRRRVDGLLLSLASETDERVVRAMRQARGPLVLVDRRIPDVPEASAVLSDHRQGWREVVGQLLDAGHRHLGLVLGPAELRMNEVRLEGVREAYAARGLEPQVAVEAGPFDRGHGEAATRRLLQRDPRPTAVLAGSQTLLVGILHTLRGRGIVVGRDLAVITCDDTELTEYLQPQIAAVARDLTELGRVAAELLLGRIAGRPRTEPVVLPTWSTMRGATAPPRQAGVDVAGASTA